jgi:hypothetical protein
VNTMTESVAITNLCSCGCGTEIFPDERGRHRNWVRGHAAIGKKQSVEWVARKVAGLKKAWTDPNKFKSTRHQSPELVEKRIAKLRGRKQSAEQIAAASRRMTGTKLKPETIAKLRVLYPNGLNLSEASEAKRRKSISDQRKGTHNFGRAARDRLDHFNALHWIVRDNRGVIHEFDNLQSWCRANEWRFQPDDRPKSKLKLWQRAVGGFNNQQRTDKKGQHQWKGWTLVSVLERRQQCAPDLLARHFSVDASMKTQVGRIDLTAGSRSQLTNLSMSG